MKKIFTIISLQFCICCFLFSATTNSKEGYFNLKWGSTVEDAKNAGYKLTRMTANSEKEYLSKLYNVPVDGYKVTSKDKKVKSLQFHYYQNKLFLVTEMLNSTDFNSQKLESRYGDFVQQEIFLVGKQYMDAKIQDGGKISFLSIMISNSSDNVSAIMYDWNVYKEISYVGQKLANKEKKSITDELSSLAIKLVQENYSKTKPSFAFMAFTTDYKNVLVDNYVTDALTEAMFNTGKVKIIERANLEAILKEQKFQASGLVNEATAKSIGMIVGVDFVCYGTLKDLGDEITVNARVVDVETGEVCAIARETIEKDTYLKDQPQSAVGVSNLPIKSSAKISTSTSKSSSQPKNTAVTNNAWKVVKYRNDFDGCTQYIFRVYSSDYRFIFVAYKKTDVKANSRVIAGVHWGDGFSWEIDGAYDIKGAESTVSKNLNDIWTYNLDASGKDKFKFVWNQKAASRWLVDIITKSDSVALRRDGLIRRFQTSGLLDKMAEYGITWEEIDAALANEEF
ncbi:MAG: hypothetical protein E7059_04830 [Treponema bryantii]|nr:hypothetical protein [Treponema bryantii]